MVSNRLRINDYFSSRLITDYFSEVNSTKRLLFFVAFFNFNLILNVSKHLEREKKKTKTSELYVILYYSILFEKMFLYI